MESLLSIWSHHEGAKGLNDWWRFPHSPGAHKEMKAEARKYVEGLLHEERRDVWPIFARGDLIELRDLWVERYATEYDGELPGKAAPHPATWASGVRVEYKEEHDRPNDDSNHIRGVGVVALQYFAEYTVAALERYGVEWEQQPQQEPDEENKPGGVVLPPKLDTPEARRAFPIAIDRVWMRPRPGGGFEWLGVGEKGKRFQLDYFCGKVYGYKWNIRNKRNEGKEMPDTDLKELFGVKGRFSSNLEKIYRGKPQPWRATIDEIFR